MLGFAKLFRDMDADLDMVRFTVCGDYESVVGSKYSFLPFVVKVPLIVRIIAKLKGLNIYILANGLNGYIYVTESTISERYISLGMSEVRRIK